MPSLSSSRTTTHGECTFSLSLRALDPDSASSPCSFMAELTSHLQAAYPLQPDSAAEATPLEVQPEAVIHVHYKGISYLAEYLPLLVTYALLFMYIYFSVSECRW